MHRRLGIALNVLYFMIWFIPFGIFCKDFFDFNKLLEIMGDKSTINIIMFSVFQALLSSVFSLIAAIIPAIYISKKNNIITKMLESALFIPFFFPAVSMIISFSLIYSNNGIFSKIGIVPNVLYTLNGIILAHVFYNSPIFVKYIGEALRRIPFSIRDNTKIDGVSLMRSIWQIEIPMILPSICKAFFLVFAYSFTSFAVILSIGGLKYGNLEVEISSLMRNGYDFSRAIIFSIIQFAILTILTMVISGVKEYEFEESRIDSGKIPYFITIISIFYLFFEYSIIFTGVLSGFFNFYTMKVDFSGLMNIFSISFNRRFPVERSIINSIVISAVAGIVSVIFSYILIKCRNRFTNSIVMSVMGLSSAVFAAMLIYTNVLYGIPFPIIFIIGYCVMSVPLSYSFLEHHIRAVNKSVLEAASVDGAGFLESILFVEVPLIFNVLVAGFFQVFAIIYGEFTLCYTLQAQNDFPLASVTNFSMDAMKYSRESSAMSSLSVIIIFILSMLSNYIVGLNLKSYNNKIFLEKNQV